MHHLTLLLSGLIAAAVTVDAKTAFQRPPATPRPGDSTSHGCFSAEGEWEIPPGFERDRVSMGFCVNVFCPMVNNATVVGLLTDACYCGFKYPPKDTQVEDEKCNYPCPAFPDEACGGIDGAKYWSVYNTGIEVAVEYVSEASTSTSGSAPSDTGAADEDKDDGGKTNVGGIVAGVVVAVVAIAGSIGGVFFYLRRKRNKEIEEEHRRNAAVNSFIGHKPPSSSGGLSISDARLDPVMAHRRLSDGSIADNQDYSRRILKVTNA